MADFARDDGIAFYVPATADGTTTNLYIDERDPTTQFRTRYYFPDGPEADAHSNKTLAFPVLAAAAAGTQPLMRVFYSNECGWSHDELAVGQERFNRVYHQGDKLPSFSLLWTGITAPTTLVVGTDTGCPFQGHLSPQAFPGITVHFGSTDIVHQPWLTMDNARHRRRPSCSSMASTGDEPAESDCPGLRRRKAATHRKMDFSRISGQRQRDLPPGGL